MSTTHTIGIGPPAPEPPAASPLGRVSPPAGKPAAGWWHPYVGLPYVGTGPRAVEGHCWGRVRQIYRDELGIALPAYGAVSAADIARVEAIVGEERLNGPWRPVRAGLEQPFDLAVITRLALIEGRYRWAPCHVGVVTDAGHMIHCDETTDMVRVAFRDGPDFTRNPGLGRQTVACFRHEGLRR